jgi:hypothetical protein
MESRSETELTKDMEVKKMAQPEKRFRCGSCKAAVFENALKRNGQPVKVKKVAGAGSGSLGRLRTCRIWRTIPCVLRQEAYFGE